MRVAIRVDSSIYIGTGHVVRCLSLADRLREKKVDIVFICRNIPGNRIDFIKDKGYRCLTLTESHNHNIPNRLQPKVLWKYDAKETMRLLSDEHLDWIIVDHYKLDYLWHKKMRGCCRNVMVIDDLANRKLDCDILLDQNYCDSFENRYDQLVPKHCRKFLGPRGLILRDEFIKLQGRSNKDKSAIKRVMLFFGGSDNSHETIKTIKILPFISDLNLNVDVILGANNSDTREIINFCQDIDKVSIYIQTDNMAEIMSVADLVIIAGGSTVWEACCIGVPAYTVITAENQNDIISYLGKMNIVNNLGLSKNLTSEDMLKAIKYACSHADLFFQMGDNASRIVSNCGDSINEITTLIANN
jgi:UDP-2,4-diacetamido-2,4,6-trideoxy-beta-L-altropyranose hydrolase